MNRHQLSVGCAIAGLSLFLASPVVLAEAKVFGGSDSVVFDTATDAPGMQLRVTGPGGFLREALFVQGELIELPISKAVGWPDGTYNFELWPVRGVAVRTSDRFAPGTDDGATAAASGSFHVVDGTVIAPDADIIERGIAQAKLVDQDGGHGTNDQVIPDDLIVQGSGCFGFDCVNNENFGFDTIRMKENNTRIKFEDTSVGAFPSTDWQLTANDSASGGQNKFSIEDVTAASVPFTIEGGATTNSLYVDSTGRIGLRTSTPVLDLHITTSNTPGIRLEQTNAGGFTAQTWDIAGNEANFFVRDVTGGSLLPFRIRPGAPTSSIDIAADGDVGIGTGSPAGSGFESRLLEIKSTQPALVLDGGDGGSNFAEVLYQEDNNNRWSMGWTGNDDRFYFYNYNRSAYDLVIRNSNGYLGLGGNLTPTAPIHHSNGAMLTAGGVWQNASSRELKDQVIKLTAAAAMQALTELEPVTFRYIADPTDLNVGFIAEDVPELVATQSHKTLSAMDIVAVLTRVVQDQEARIAELTERLEQVERGSD